MVRKWYLSTNCHWKDRSYCSNKCAVQHNHPLKPIFSRASQCKQCGKDFEFVPKRKHLTRIQHFCSLSCKGEWANRSVSKWSCIPWSQEEMDYLVKKYPTSPQPKLLAQEMGRSLSALNNRAKRLGLIRSKEAISEGRRIGGRKNKGNKRPDFRKNSFVGIGPNNPFYGKKHSEETRKKISEHAKNLGRFKKLNNDPEFQKKRFKGLIKRPNKPEMLLNRLLQEMYPGEYKYVGDGSLIIERLSPDFVNVNGKKKIIELFGEQYHHPDYAVRELKYRATEDGRKEIFGRFGYDTLIVWAKELYHNEEELKNKIKEFHENSCI